MVVSAVREQVPQEWFSHRNWRVHESVLVFFGTMLFGDGRWWVLTVGRRRVIWDTFRGVGGCGIGRTGVKGISGDSDFEFWRLC